MLTVIATNKILTLSMTLLLLYKNYTSPPLHSILLKLRNETHLLTYFNYLKLTK